MENLTDVQKRILQSALVADGRLILWVLTSGRVVLPGFDEDVAAPLRTLRGAGLLAVSDSMGHAARAAENLPVGSHIVRLSDSGLRAARESLGQRA